LGSHGKPMGNVGGKRKKTLSGEGARSAASAGTNRFVGRSHGG